jgi:phosphate uptake regulator
MSMHIDAITAMCTADKELAADVIRTDDEVDRFSLYILRNLALGLSA